MSLKNKFNTKNLFWFPSRFEIGFTLLSEWRRQNQLRLFITVKVLTLNITHYLFEKSYYGINCRKSSIVLGHA
jgi:hypothetical protein